MHNIAIIGIGNLGLRHFQAILNCEQNMNIYIVDTVNESLERASAMLEEKHTHKVHKLNNVSELPNELEVVIIATSSNVRAKLTKKLLSGDRTVKYLVLEKVLFQTEKDYKEIGDLLKEKGVKTWVNCPRRMYDGYKTLKQKLENDNINNVVITGGNWGLGCNSIHMIDMISYLVGELDSIDIKTDMLDPEIISSKRDGFVEFTGTLCGNINNETSFAITSNADTNEPIRIYISCGKNNILIKENKNCVDIINKDNFEQIELGVKFQSQMSNVFVEQLINTGECDLPTFETSSKLHLAIINGFLTYMQKQGEARDGVCKIT